jgi:hypothetical protein
MKTFTCPDCEHRTPYRPQECERFARYEGNKRIHFRLLFCRGCGREHEVPEGGGVAPGAASSLRTPLLTRRLWVGNAPL